MLKIKLKGEELSVPEGTRVIDLVKEEEKIVLRVRDDGPFFNPLEYGSGKEAETDDDIEGLSGIKIIKSLADRLDYSRVLNMNNTIVEISARIGDER